MVQKATEAPVGTVGIVSTEIAVGRTLDGIVAERICVGVLITRLTVFIVIAAMRAPRY